MSMHTAQLQDLIAKLRGVPNTQPGQVLIKGTQRLGVMADDANKAFGGPQFVDDVINLVPAGKGRGMLQAAAKSGVGRFAGRAVPVLSAVQAVGDVGDVVFGDESLGNKAMDAASMGVGGTIAGALSLGNPLAIAAGASIGKSASDGLQYLFGDKKTPDQRKMEEALALLQMRGQV